MTVAGGQSFYQSGNPADDVFLGNDPGARTVRANFDRRTFAPAAQTLVSGTMRVAPVVLFTNDLITHITVRSNTTAAVTPTNWWFALYSDDAAPTLLQQTADQLTTAWAASTVKSVALALPVTITRTGVYYVGVMMAAATPVNVDSVASQAGYYALLSFQKAAGASTAGLTTTAPASMGSITIGGGPAAMLSSAI